MGKANPLFDFIVGLNESKMLTEVGVFFSIFHLSKSSLLVCFIYLMRNGNRKTLILNIRQLLDTSVGDPTIQYLS